MQNFIVKVYQQLKSRLCERRNKRPAINPYAIVQRTDIIERKYKTYLQSPIQIRQTNIDKQNIINQSNAQHPQQNYPQLIHQNQQLPIIRPKQSQYRIQYKKLQQEQTDTQDQSHLQELIRSQANIDHQSLQFQNIINQIQSFQIKDNQRKKYFWKKIYKNYSQESLDNQISQLISDHQDQLQLQGLDKITLKKGYEIDITQVRQLKYTGELIDYPQISEQTYQHIRNLWLLARKNSNQIIKHMKLKILDKLTYRSFKTLSYGCWLNDQIINGYLELIQTKAFQVGKQYKVLNSFFAQTTFSKSNQLIERALKRKKIDKRNIILIALNNGNHWFFAKITNSKIIVYDSIPKNPQSYLNYQSTKDIFQNIIRFANWYYGTNHFIQVCQNYPQQQNSYDCGMFLISGIKDIVRDYSQWSFSQFDINFKRLQVAKQLLYEEVSGFNN